MINLLAQVEQFHGFNIATIFGGRTSMKNIHDSTIGKLLLRANIIQRSELDAALRNAKKNGSQLGQELVELGVITDDTVCQALRVQQLLREGAIEEKWAEMAMHLGLDAALL